MSPSLDETERQDIAIEAAADALLAACAVQTGTDPHRAMSRARTALHAVWERAEQEEHQHQQARRKRASGDGGS